MALCTAAQIRDALSLASEAALNTLLGTYATRVGSILAFYCGYPPASVGVTPTLESASYTRYLGDSGLRVSGDGRVLVLEPWPVTAITTIHDDPDEDYGADTLVASGDYDQRGAHGHEIRLRRDGAHSGWSSSERALKVVFTAGFTTVPASLEQAAVELAAHLYLQRGRRGLSSEGQPDLQTSYRGEEIPLAVRQLVNPYRLPSVYL